MTRQEKIALAAGNYDKAARKVIGLKNKVQKALEDLYKKQKEYKSILDNAKDD